MIKVLLSKIIKIISRTLIALKIHSRIVNQFNKLRSESHKNEDHSKFIAKSVKHNLFWSNKIKNNLERFNIFCNKVSANFLLINFDKCKLTANNVEKKLLKKGIILRETKTYGIKNCLRLTIGNNLENKLFLKSIEKIFKNV